VHLALHVTTLGKLRLARAVGIVELSGQHMLQLVIVAVVESHHRVTFTAACMLCACM
jgi:hypothetical protein